MRILCVLLPHFPINCEKLRNHDTIHPLIMTTTVGSQKLVLDYSPEYKSLQREMPLQQEWARGLVNISSIGSYVHVVRFALDYCRRNSINLHFRHLFNGIGNHICYFNG